MKNTQNQEIVLFGVDDADEKIFIPEIKIQYNSGKEIKHDQFTQPEQFIDFIRSLYEEDSIEVQEQVFILFLNRANKIKGYYKHTVGGIDMTIVDIRLILAIAIKSLSVSIIMIHNHPSGNVLPSDADNYLTKKIREAAKAVDIKLLDSIIITKDNFFSFVNESHLLGLTDASQRYPLSNKGNAGKAKRHTQERKTNINIMPGKPKKVKSLTEEIKFIRRFVGLHNKIKTPNAVLTFIKALQKAITQRLISKDSAFVKEIYYIQDTLIEFYNRMKGEMRIQLEDKTLAKLVAISGDEEVYPSVGFIKTFIAMQGREISEEKKSQYVERLVKAARNKKIYPDDPFLNKLNKIYHYFKATHKPGDKVAFAKAELNGLACICNENKKALGAIYNTKGKAIRRCQSGKYSNAKKGACSYNKGLSGNYINFGELFDTKGKKVRRCRSGKYSDAKAGACSYNKGLSGIMTAEEVANMKFDLLQFSGEWEKLIGKPEKNFSMMIHGEPGAGKTVFLLKFTKYLSALGSVLYMTSEEFGSATLTEKVNAYLNPIPSNVTFVSRLGIANINEFNFVIFDSVTDLKITLEQYKQLKGSYPNTAFILIMQNTKGGLFKGGKDWEHEVQIAGEVVNGLIQIYKNRYGKKGSMNFFEKK